MSRDVRRMFASIAPAYDRANRVLSMGVDRHWRHQAVRRSGVRPGDRVLDCATGTGDLARAFANAVGDDGLVVGADFCREMVVEAPDLRSGPVDYHVADALALPYEDGAFDVASIAFGVRNVDDPVQCLAELGRVVRPGGRVVVLEFGQPDGLLGAPFRLYSRHVIPWVGGALTGNREAYEYLPRTSAAFPAGTAFLDLMADAKVFADAQAHRLSGGIAWTYVGLRA